MPSVGEIARTGDRWAERIGRRLPELCALYPVLWLGVVYHLAWMAQAQLGRWPRPSLDDPKALGEPVPTLHLVAMLLLVAWPLSWCLGLVGLGLGWRRDDACRAGARLAVLMAANALVLGLARWDPGRVFEWLLD